MVANIERPTPFSKSLDPPLLVIRSTKLSVTIFILISLLQISYIFIFSAKVLNVQQISTENHTFAIIFTLLQVWECMGYILDNVA